MAPSENQFDIPVEVTHQQVKKKMVVGMTVWIPSIQIFGFQFIQANKCPFLLNKYLECLIKKIMEVGEVCINKGDGKKLEIVNERNNR